MPFTQSPYDGASLHYRRYVPQTSAPSFRASAVESTSRPSLVFSAAWPFNSHQYDHLMTTLSEAHRYPCVLADRRGYGSSDWSGPDAFQKHEIGYDTFALDLRHVINTSGVAEDAGFVAIGTSMGCGEIIHALTHDTSGTLMKGCRGLIFICPSLPVPLWTERKPTGPKREFWDGVLDSLREDPDEGIAKTLPVIFGSYLESMPNFQRARYERMLEHADKVAAERTVQIFLNHDFTDEMKELGSRLEVPVLILHGSEDYANPVDVNAVLVRDSFPGSELKVYEGAAHGELCMKTLFQ